jgi:molecular chaperone GrpE
MAMRPRKKREDEERPEEPVAGTETDTADQEDAAELRGRLDDALERWKRAQADFQNLKRRQQGDIDAAVRRTVQPLLEDLLRVADHFEMALSAPTTNDESRALADGVRLIRDQLDRALRQAGVEPLDASGALDPNLHEAVATVPDADAAPGTIVDVLQTGYLWNDVVLRHARVRVAVEPPSGDEAEG